MLLSLLARLPPRLGIVLAAALALYTTHKLYTMCRYRGFVGDRHVETHYVTDKTVERGSKSRTFCFVSWADDGRGDEHRVQADCERSATLHTGDRIEVVRLEGERNAYLRDDDLYAGNGNFIIDFALLGAELAAILYYVNRRRNQT